MLPLLWHTTCHPSLVARLPALPFLPIGRKPPKLAASGCGVIDFDDEVDGREEKLSLAPSLSNSVQADYDLNNLENEG